jgi:hypothetical protein
MVEQILAYVFDNVLCILVQKSLALCLLFQGLFAFAKLIQLFHNFIISCIAKIPRVENINCYQVAQIARSPPQNFLNLIKNKKKTQKLMSNFSPNFKFKISQPKVINYHLLGDFCMTNFKFLTDFKFKIR